MEAITPSKRRLHPTCFQLIDESGDFDQSE